MAGPPGEVRLLRPREHDGAVRLALQWLADRHRKGWHNALQQVYRDWLPAPDGSLPELDDALFDSASVNAAEWLLARGSIQARGALRPINDYLLGPEGPPLTPGQQRWIRQLHERPLRLYRITDVIPGRITFVDALDDAAEPIQVHEVAGSRDARPGMLWGLRILDVGDPQHGGHREMSGAIYPFAMLAEAGVIHAVRAAEAGAADDANRRELAEAVIARRWMAQWFGPPPLPTLVDASTGEPMLLVTDHYRVLDAAALAAALAGQPDVSGDAAAGWLRERAGDDGTLRPAAVVNPGRAADRIEVFYRTQRLADEGRGWFDALAGGAVQHLTREIADPAGAAAAAIGDDGATADDADTGDGVPPEEITRALEQMLRKHYANWCDEPIPALNGRTPREAIRTAAGLERVKGLLRSYEDRDAAQSRSQRRPAISYQFLWDALGIERR